MKQMDTHFSSANCKKCYGNAFFSTKNKIKSICITIQKSTFLFGNFIQVFCFGHFKNVHFQKPNRLFKILKFLECGLVPFPRVKLSFLIAL